MHGGSYRFATQILWSDWIEGLDGNIGTGTVTSWRIVNLANRDYLELMLGW